MMLKTPLLLVFISFFSTGLLAQESKIYISPTGNDYQKGDMHHPLQNITTALERVKELQRQGKNFRATIILKDGIYYLNNTITIDNSTRGITVKAEHEGRATLSAGIPLQLTWQLYRDGIWKAAVKQGITEIPSLYGNDSLLTLARYPNYQAGILPFGGYGNDALSAQRIKTWNDPAGAYLHALHSGRWGGMHFEITGKVSDTSVSMIGGWQNNRPSKPHPLFRYVENIKEELDAPGEWFFDEKERMLYYIPKQGENIHRIHFIAGHLESCLHLEGTEAQPLNNIHIEGIQFKHTVPTFMKTEEPLMRSDWRVYRQAAIYISHTQNVLLANNTFSLLGGNGIFVSYKNKNVAIKDNLLERLGASAILFVGGPDAVYNPLYNYGDTVNSTMINRTPGPKNDNYPVDCIAAGNLIHDIGLIEKQSAGVQIQIASRISVIHNSIYNVPRAGINVGDGAFGGHDIAYNDVFNTVLETSDHGAFNSWGRDRYWQANRAKMNALVAAEPGLILLDAYQVTKIHDNLFQCDHGWDIDLDDGSSNYNIYNNLCLSGGIKLREGFHRKVSNNILVNNSLHPHVWFKHSEDTVQNNVLMTAFSPIQVADFGDQVDNNVFISEKSLQKNQTLGIDQHSIFTSLKFKAPAQFDYTITNIDAVAGKFSNIPMQQFGVTRTFLKNLALKPPAPQLISQEVENKQKIIQWGKYQIKNITTLGEQSATGLADRNGVLIIKAPQQDGNQKSLQVNDVILKLDRELVQNVEDLLMIERKHRWKGHHEFTVWRDQKEILITN